MKIGVIGDDFTGSGDIANTLAKAGALFLSCPAAFMKTTGQAHWHTLIRARAIETGCYMIAPCQNGSHGRVP